MMDVRTEIKRLAAESKEEVLAIRRHLHANPELSFQEEKTAQYIAEHLSKLGIEVQQNIGGHGLVAVIGKGAPEKVLALRADMDALPIQEMNDVSYRSVNQGVMHACGHDVHTACLLGAVGVLKQIEDELKGSIKIIFQPAEEQLPGGASLMIKDGVLKDPEVGQMIGQHVYPELEVGKVGFRSGMYMASTDELHVTVLGKGGHAALPHKIIDPVLITSHMITALQQVVSRRTNPTLPAVLSFGDIHGHGATNVIPDKVELQGTFRTFDENWRAEAHAIMKHMATSLVEGMGGKVDFEIRKGYPFLTNDEVVTAKARSAAEAYLGKENVVDLDLRMTAEDFAYFSQEVPSCFYRLGVRNEDRGITSNLHSSTFDIDETSLEIGAGLMAWIAYSLLQEANEAPAS